MYFYVYFTYILLRTGRVIIESVNYSAAVYTLGCKVNFYESEAISEALASKGVRIRSFDDVCDIYIINTCTVTADSDRKALKFIRRAHRLNPDAFIAVTGCLAQRKPELIAGIGGVSLITGNEDKISVADRILKYASEHKSSGSGESGSSESGSGGSGSRAAEIDIMPFTERLAGPSVCRFGRTRAYIKIEDGCSSHCAYCIIPKARGPVRSRPIDDVMREVRALAQGGCREVVVTGIEISSYSYDLISLLKEIDDTDGISRIRLGSLDPFYISRDVTDGLKSCKKLCPHFHISLQSGSSRVLAAMKRKYNADTAMRNIMYLKDSFPGCCLFADVIVGFPGETESDFNDTVDFINNVRFLHLHIFPYSKREGTAAFDMKDQVPSDVKKERAARLAGIQADIKKELLDERVRSGAKANVLFETYKGGILKGHSDDFIEFTCASDHNMRGRFGTVIPVSSDGESITGYLLSSSSDTSNVSSSSTNSSS